MKTAVPILLFGGFIVTMIGFAVLLYSAYYLPFGISIQQGAGYAIILGICIAIIGGVLSVRTPYQSDTLSTDG